MKCAFNCGKEVHPGEDYREEATGWIYRGRKQGGANQLELMQLTGAVAHRHCVNKAKTVHPDQAELLDAV